MFAPDEFVTSSMVLDIIVFVQSAGVDDNDTIKVYRSGGADPDGSQPGDLYVTIKVSYIICRQLFFIFYFWNSCKAVITVSTSFIWYS